MTEVNYNISQGATWSELLRFSRDEGTKEVIPANEISRVDVTLRRETNRNSPVVLAQENLARVGNDYPLALTPDQTENIGSGRVYGHVKLTYSTGVVTYPCLLVLTLDPTTT